MVDLEAIAAQIRADVAKIDKTQTNYEKIISMSPEELADAMLPLASGEAIKIPFCTDKPECNKLLDTEGSIPESMCKKCLMNWLQQEVKN